jgi:hypothetical protein
MVAYDTRPKGKAASVLLALVLVVWGSPRVLLFNAFSGFTRI